MLLDLRDRVKGSKWLGITIVVIIAIPFALVGIGSYLSGGGDHYAAKVNDEEISVRTYEQNYFAQRSQLQSMFGGQIPASFASGSFLREQALEASVTQALLSQHASEKGYAVGDQLVASSIINEPAFQVDGAFDKARYERQLQSQGLTAQQFEARLREDLAVNQMREGILLSTFQTTHERDAAIALRDQIRTFSLLTFAVDDIDYLPAPTESAVDEYFSNNASAFVNPEAVKLEYLELSIDDLAAQVEVDDELLLAAYENEKSNYVNPEQRRASHILLTTSDDDNDDDREAKRQQLMDIRSQALNGVDFAELAEEFSDDPGSASQGGDLGAFPRGVMVPEFEEAAFSLNTDELSDVVESSFGFHLIKVTDVIEEQGQSFEEARFDVEQAYRARESESLFFELSDALANEVYENSDSLDSAAAALGSEVKETDFLATTDRSDIFSHSAVRNAAFDVSLREEGLNSEVIEIGENHVVVIRVQEYREASPQTVDEVRDDIEAILVQQEREKKLDQLAAEAIEALNGGSDLVDVSDQLAASNAQSNVSANRQETAVDANILRTLFSMPKPTGSATYESVNTVSGDKVVIALSAVDQPQGNNAVDADVEAERANIGRNEYAAWLSAMRDRAEVIINNQLLDEVSR
ncbi:MAG: SurA N-terminal domain-containing protein [Pseudomonadota bacterium]